MKKKLKEKIGLKSNLADNVSNLIGYLGIAGKNKLEDWGFAKTEDFTSFSGLD